jgi:RNA polymerase sigma-70 factor (ECF subfamily)
MTVQSSQTEAHIDDIINLYDDLVYLLAFSYVRNKYDADDIFQNVFLRYISKSRIFESEEHRKAWLIRTAINQCKKILTIYLDSLSIRILQFVVLI